MKIKPNRQSFSTGGKDFDCVKMMRDIRDKMSLEIANMDAGQLKEYFRKGKRNV